jgi:hypothetical protein
MRRLRRPPRCRDATPHRQHGHSVAPWRSGPSLVDQGQLFRFRLGLPVSRPRVRAMATSCRERSAALTVFSFACPSFGEHRAMAGEALARADGPDMPADRQWSAPAAPQTTRGFPAHAPATTTSRSSELGRRHVALQRERTSEITHDRLDWRTRWGRTRTQGRAEPRWQRSRAAAQAKKGPPSFPTMARGTGRHHNVGEDSDERSRQMTAPVRLTTRATIPGKS